MGSKVYYSIEASTADVEIKLDGSGSWSLGNDFELIHAPGHTEVFSVSLLSFAHQAHPSSRFRLLHLPLEMSTTNGASIALSNEACTPSVRLRSSFRTSNTKEFIASWSSNIKVLACRRYVNSPSLPPLVRFNKYACEGGWFHQHKRLVFLALFMRLFRPF
ncbi:hypothetical protein Syun_022845 [Stephania yunnanensis]|uniref:Uncharacterized protein n=1 Tax=Stephania yunnanensis TaxID=152371 RepID=A0AAP0F8G6_9MAGN